MPIRPEMKARYPKDWAIRSRFVRFYRAKNRCEWCGVKNHSIGWRDDDGVFHDAETCSDYEQHEYAGQKRIKIVLTVAHVHDHRPEAASLLNLAALCQKCHNGHDAEMRRENIRKRKLAESGQRDLFEA